MSRFKSAKHFASWLGLCPGTKISGGKILSGASKRTTNRAAQSLRLAAAALHKSQSALGAYFRRLIARLDRARAITVTAHKLAHLIYIMLTKGAEYTDQRQDYYEERYRQRVMHHLAKRAEKLGMRLVPAPLSTKNHSINHVDILCFLRRYSPVINSSHFSPKAPLIFLVLGIFFFHAYL
ncbi:MAG: transposase [Nitrosomonas sp.]|nr:transposase [Nitrosomonas sp.]